MGDPARTDAPLPPARRDTVIDALMACITSSALKDTVPAEALRSVLGVRYRDLLKDGVLDLSQVWELLADQPGFDADEAAPPLCRFRSWEGRLGMRVRLPAHLEELAPSQREELASRCRADFPGAAPTSTGKAPAAKADLRPAGRRDSAGSPRRGHRALGLKVLLLAVAAVVAFSAAGLMLWRELGGGPELVELRADLGALPAGELRRRGSEAVATLTENGWLQLPEIERRAHLEEALRALARADVAALVLRDAGGQVVATARLHPETRTLQVWFR